MEKVISGRVKLVESYDVPVCSLDCKVLVKLLISEMVLSGAAAPPISYRASGLQRWVEVKVSRKIKLLR